MMEEFVFQSSHFSRKPSIGAKRLHRPQPRLIAQRLEPGGQIPQIIHAHPFEQPLRH